MGKATCGRKRMELLHDMMEGKDYGQLNDLSSDRSECKAGQQVRMQVFVFSFVNCS